MKKYDTVISELKAKIQAQEKTIEVLMTAAEQRSASGSLSMEMLSQNLNLERIVQQKTEILKKQEERLRKALKDLQETQARLLQAQKLESVGQLAAGIAHEINTPTQFITSNINFLDESFDEVKPLIEILKKILETNSQGKSPDAACKEAANLLEDVDWAYLEQEIPKALQQTQEGLHRVTTIVRALKEFSHPGHKEMGLNDLNKIIETTVIIARNEWKYCAEIQTNLAPNLPRVHCLADEMGQVFLNLLMNASHAISEIHKNDNEKGLITISSRRVDDKVEICVADTGCGIPEKIRARIFDPFFTTKVVGQGTGQGLAICHDVIEKKHGGVLLVDSEEGRGSIFTIRLPLHKDKTAR